MLKILYISPENTVGTLSYWKQAHELNGHYCRYVTFYPTAAGYAEDIALRLPLVAARTWYLKPRLWLARVSAHRHPYDRLPGYPPVWKPPRWQQQLIRLRELLWIPRINRAIQEHNLAHFDIYHFEWGLDFYRDASFARQMHQQGKKIICHYHGQDLRNRGVIPAMDALSDLNLTNELDLLQMHPKMHYLFLPFDVQAFQPKTQWNDPPVICHATTNRIVKGTDTIIRICRELERSHSIRFVLIENQPHARALALKQQADIYIDQVTDHAWGYGMNSLEALSMGLVCVTYLNPTYGEFIPDHPFVNAHQDQLKAQLTKLLEHPETLPARSRASRYWVEKTHDFRNVVKELYRYYRQLGIAV
jgi:hypothetical protein